MTTEGQGMDAPTPATPAEAHNNQTAMERIAALEADVALLKRALYRAYGVRWMDELKGTHEPAG